ncbi:MAG: response regulator transcription factor [Alphaproteobacteria bacterium]|nr:response regulator transcription factor [Alphaproteobacteria bacterium]
MSKRLLLLVDDDQVLRQSLAEQLAAEADFEVMEAGTCAAARQAVAAGRPIDLVLLDVGLPDGDGRELCRELRQGGLKSPIVMLTASGADADTIVGLDSGANDYIAKPVRYGVLAARIRAQLRQAEQSEDAILAIGPYRFQPARRVLFDDARKKRIRLTDKEAAILRHLHRAGSKPVPRDTLLTEVWGYNPEVTTHTLETHIYRLRRKIEKDPSKAAILVTEPGGYRLIP